ncbi:MAG: succinyldiaminopimelate transaminase [Galactobacter sp.]|uniref:succinyldiaminopimelate transaminase n=1 Tax=Galactobacter sp. TaxID=2676125 RepID=UPI0025BB1119|nr:succinyldiaminopimelate transaminase [Galactobacter sp.]
MVLKLPDYPWETLAPYRARAAEHPGGTVDLSIGTPVDPTPQLIQDALARAADAHGYPTTHGSPAVRQAIVDWFRDRRATTHLATDHVMPTVGSKELVAWLPLLLGLGEGDVVVRPRVAYPTYDIGARLVGAKAIAADSLGELEAEDRDRVKLVWLNSPGNPTGSVLDVDSLKARVDQARELGAVVASDECYAELGWGDWDGDAIIPSVLSDEVSGGDLTGLLAAYSLSKQSNLAGYRAAFLAGAPDLFPDLVNSRKHAGMIVPAPVQAAMVAALGDHAHVVEQKDRYRARREAILPALESAGFRVDSSEAGLYLWVTRNENCWESIGWLAERGIVAGPGAFYGEAGKFHVRIAITASDERIAAAAERLTA